jgi:hypothetical protein
LTLVLPPALAARAVVLAFGDELLLDLMPNDYFGVRLLPPVCTT